jgi:Predicted permeases
MLKYFDDIIGKDLGWDVLGTLLFYFAIFMTPVALPLGVLLSSLITFGNLGEHFELTAIKSLGISLLRSLIPIFIFVLFLTGIAFLANNYLVPKAALEAYSLLYDIKQKKPALDLKEGAFYGSIPDINIKVNKKFKDGMTLKGIIIYDHRNKVGNKDVTVADSGKMFTILNDTYLKMELFDGYNYSEGTASGTDAAGRAGQEETLSKTKFSKTQIVFDLSTFGLNRTDKKWFQSNRIMRNLSELKVDMDSVQREIQGQQIGINETQHQLFAYHFKYDSIPLTPELKAFKVIKDSLAKSKSEAKGVTDYASFQDAVKGTAPITTERAVKKADSIFSAPPNHAEISAALGRARMIKSQLLNSNTNLISYESEFKVFEIQWHKILSNSLACIAMFLIGAPLGAIIKKGGLGVPVIVSIFFFIIFYVLNLLGEKWAKQELISVPVGVWGANMILFFFGMIFLRQARRDARLFEADFYNVIWDRLKRRFTGKNADQEAT